MHCQPCHHTSYQNTTARLEAENVLFILHNSLYIFNTNSALLDEYFAGIFSDLSQFHKDFLVLMHFLENHFS